MSQSRPLAFISYRREDSREWASLLAECLRTAFGPDAVFIDIDSIRTGDRWSERIQQSLERATVLLPVIGQHWLFVQDAAGRRRLDVPGDWVCDEVHFSLRNGMEILPLLVSGASMPSARDLPPAISQLENRQYIRITDRRDVDRVVDDLSSRFGFSRIRAELDYPTPVDRSPALPREELDAKLRELNEWRRVERPVTRGKAGTSEELLRIFKFQSFEDAMHFMSTAARFVSQTGHHPFWENQYKDLRVSLTSWDVGHRITYKDVRLAEYLERLYRDYALQ